MQGDKLSYTINTKRFLLINSSFLNLIRIFSTDELTKASYNAIFLFTTIFILSFVSADKIKMAVKYNFALTFWFI